jgi:hypothetical protein
MGISDDGEFTKHCITVLRHGMCMPTSAMPIAVECGVYILEGG